MDNLSLREEAEKCRQLDEDVKLLQQQLGGLEATGLEREKHELKQQYTCLEREASCTFSFYRLSTNMPYTILNTVLLLLSLKPVFALINDSSTEAFVGFLAT